MTSPDDSALPPELNPRGPRQARGTRPGGGTPPRPPRRTRRRRGLRWALGGGGTLVVVIVLFVVIVGLVAFGKIGRLDPFGGYQQVPDADTHDLNILVVGSDSRAGLSPAEQKELHVGDDPGQRTDTMMIVHVPAGSGKVTIVSLPRDSYVRIPAYTAAGHSYPASMNKLNAAFSLGGADLITHTVEADTGIHIDHYVQLNFSGFVSMVNAVGGVTVCTDTPIHDPVRRNPDGSGYVGSGLQLPKGKSHLDGVRALEYVRAREFDPTEDLGRMRRQQEFIADLLHQAKSASTLLNPIRLTQLLTSLGSSLTVDNGFGKAQMISLLMRVHSLSPNNVQTLTVPLADPTNPSTDEMIAGAETSVVEWDPTESKLLFNDLEHDQPVKLTTGAHKVQIAPSSIALTVLNATTTQGFAATAASSLSSHGFRITKTANAPAGSDPAQTVVEYGADRAQSAQTVRASVPGSVLKQDPSLGAQGLELIVGSDYHGTVPVKVASNNSPVINTAAGSQCATD